MVRPGPNVPRSSRPSAADGVPRAIKAYPMAADAATTSAIRLILLLPVNIQQCFPVRATAATGSPWFPAVKADSSRRGRSALDNAKVKTPKAKVPQGERCSNSQELGAPDHRHA